MAIRILTDSTSDIPRSQADQWGLEIAPLKVRFGSERIHRRRHFDAPGIL